MVKTKSSERKNISSLKPMEDVTEEAVKTMHYLSYVFLLGGIAAVIAWMVFIAKWNIDYYDPQGAAAKAANRGADTAQKVEICFQAAVAAFLIYFALRFHFHKH